MGGDAAVGVGEAGRCGGRRCGVGDSVCAAYPYNIISRPHDPIPI